MKAVIYARYSSDNQREESIDGQLRECMEYAKFNGIDVVNSYIDRALSAKTDNRPNFQRMIKDSYKGLFDVVLVWKLDRFARNRYDSAHYKTIREGTFSKGNHFRGRRGYSARIYVRGLCGVLLHRTRRKG